MKYCYQLVLSLAYHVQFLHQRQENLTIEIYKQTFYSFVCLHLKTKVTVAENVQEQNLTRLSFFFLLFRAYCYFLNVN